MGNNFLTDKEFWIKNTEEYGFHKHGDNHGISRLIKKNIPENVNGHCLEIGSFPGPFLTVFGDLGYTLNGLDFNPFNETALPSWLKSFGYKTNEFQSVDFFQYQSEKEFDVVASFGFIEHFIDFNDVISRHAVLVKKDGYLIITTPNFSGLIQFWLHKIFDQNNLALHNTKSMNPTKWKKQLQELNFEILYSGYFGDFWFWHGKENLPWLKRKLLWFIERAVSVLRKIIWFQSPAFSAYAGIVARKKQNINTEDQF